LFKLDDKSSPVNPTHYATLHPQNGERIVAIDSVTSLHLMYRIKVRPTVLTSVLTLTYDLDFQYPTNYGHRERKSAENIIISDALNSFLKLQLAFW